MRDEVAGEVANSNLRRPDPVTSDRTSTIAEGGIEWAESAL
jgi:hypothetical protein